MFSSILSKRVVVQASTATRSFSTTEKTWKVYLSGEIHSDWREVIAKGVSEKGLPVSITSPNTSHEDSDDCGAIILGMEEERRNWDKIGRFGRLIMVQRHVSHFFRFSVAYNLLSKLRGQYERNSYQNSTE